MLFWGRVPWGKGPGARNVKVHLNHLECIDFSFLRHAADPCFWTYSHWYGWKLLKAGAHLHTLGCAGLTCSLSLYSQNKLWTGVSSEIPCLGLLWWNFQHPCCSALDKIFACLLHPLFPSRDSIHFNYFRSTTFIWSWSSFHKDCN